MRGIVDLRGQDLASNDTHFNSFFEETKVLSRSFTILTRPSCGSLEKLAAELVGHAVSDCGGLCTICATLQRKINSKFAAEFSVSLVKTGIRRFFSEAKKAF